ncbi:MAG: mechanosensitive ion channel family protein [Myxococcales bacterium]|nr:mechanosensitive ion channel family protein [Myxococcales bacterium]
MDALWADLGVWGQSTVIVLGAVLALVFVQRVLLRGLGRLASSTENDLDDRLVHFARRFAGIVITFLAIAGLLRVHGVEITPLLAGAGIAGIAIGLAAKETITDILAGIFLIADRPLRIGDRVKIEPIGGHWGGWGDVLDIGLRRTIIRNTDGVIVSYPNGALASSVVTNFTFERSPVRVRVRFQVDYGADPSQVRALAIATLAQVPGIVPDTVDVVLTSIWDDARGNLLAGLLFEGRYRIEDVRQRTRIRSAALEALLLALRREGVPLPASRVALVSAHEKA